MKRKDQRPTSIIISTMSQLVHLQSPRRQDMHPMLRMQRRHAKTCLTAMLTVAIRRMAVAKSTGERPPPIGVDLAPLIMGPLGGETHGRLRILGAPDAQKLLVEETSTGTRTATKIGPAVAATTMLFGGAQMLLVEGTTIGTTTATKIGAAAATMSLKEALQLMITSGGADHGVGQVGLRTSWTGRTSRSR